MDENREISSAPSADCEEPVCVKGPKPHDGHALLESRTAPYYPVNRPNKGRRQLPAEVGEGRVQLENI